MTIDRHHLLECILWPNGDGTFRKIINRAKRLDELGVYKGYKLTIPIEHKTHMTMHSQFKKGTEYELSGERNPRYGISGENHPTWKGDKAEAGAMYKRAKKLYKSGKITEEEFQPYRDAWAECQRLLRKRRAKQKASEN